MNLEGTTYAVEDKLID
jgi:hypothetical protein